MAKKHGRDTGKSSLLDRALWLLVAGALGAGTGSSLLTVETQSQRWDDRFRGADAIREFGRRDAQIAVLQSEVANQQQRITVLENRLEDQGQRLRAVETENAREHAE